MTAALQEARSRETLSRAEAAPTNRKRVVIIGGGFAGVAAARALKRSKAEVVLIDRRNHHIFQPLLYQVATAVLAPSEIAAPIRQLEAKQANLNVMLADVVDVNLTQRTVDALVMGQATLLRCGSISSWSPQARVRAISATMNSRPMHRGSRTSPTPRRFERRS